MPIVWNQTKTKLLLEFERLIVVEAGAQELLVNGL
jgi:hypothetical protein